MDRSTRLRIDFATQPDVAGEAEKDWGKKKWR
jgi:hypothetical protein